MMRSGRSIFFLAVVLFLSAVSALPKNAPVKFQATLLSLYRGSDVIFVGRYDKKEEYGANRVGVGYTVVSTKTYFDVTSVLKGSPRKFFVLDDEEYRYQIEPKNGGEAPRQAVFIEDIETFDADKQPRPGDTVLVFLRQEGDSVVLTDHRDGIKKLSPSDQSVFVARINELNEIFSEKPDAVKIADWLVRCAEQPITRWDGAHELVQGFRRLDWQQKSEDGDYESIDPSTSPADGLDAARSLTEEQKSALMQILFIPDSQSSEGKTFDLSAGNRELVTLIKRWNPSFVAGYLLEQLRSNTLSYHADTGIMFTISELLGNQQTRILAHRFAELSSLDGGGMTCSESGKARAVDDNRLQTLKNFISLASRLLAASTAKQPS